MQQVWALKAPTSRATCSWHLGPGVAVGALLHPLLLAQAYIEEQRNRLEWWAGSKVGWAASGRGWAARRGSVEATAPRF